MPRPLYCFAAIVLGFIWYAAMIVSFIPRMPQILKTFPDPFDLRILLMCAVSVALAVLFRRWIVGAKTIGQALVLALGLPLVGTMLYISAVLAPSAISRADSGLALVKVVVMLPILSVAYVPLFVADGFWYMAPMGLISQLVMSRIGRGTGSPVDKPLLLMSLVCVSASVAFAAYRWP